MKTFHYLVTIFLLIGIVSCSKEGSEGPMGPQGEQGRQGEQGVKGMDGTMLRYGKGAPSASVGQDGDFYIDVDNSKLYGPKSNGSWGTATDIKGDTGTKGDKGNTGAKGDKGDTGSRGATGAKGADGSQFLSGSAVPTTQGKTGDFYFRTTTAVLYGPKTATGWGAGVSLKGAKGEDGKTILHGAANPTADIGNIGDFYINTNSYVLFGPKTASGWGSGKSILGINGSKGDKGEKGDKGAKGDKGEAEYVILSGITNPTAALGNMGDFYFNSATKVLFFRFFQFTTIGVNPWSQVAKLSNTIQFTGKVNRLNPQSGFNGGDNWRDAAYELDLPWATFEKSVVHVYLQSDGNWYPMPGRLSSSRYDMYFSKSSYIGSDSNKTYINFKCINGGTTYYNVPIRIIVTEAEVFRTISKAIDFGDYNKVKSYFELDN